MYLSIVLIDILTPDGILTSYKVIPTDNDPTVVIDKIRDIFPEKHVNVLDLGGTRIYNSDKCLINLTDAHLRNFQEVNNKFSFRFEHRGIPVGYIKNIEGGIYNFVLASGYRFTDFHIIDPYDSNEDIHEKREFRYKVIWDKKLNVQLVEMDLRSRHGTFSFIACGSFIRVGLPGDHVFVKSEEFNWNISALTSYDMLNDQDQEILKGKIEKKLTDYN